MFPMEMASSLPDHVLQQIERLARRLKRSRSTLFAEAVAEYLRYAREAIVNALNGVARESVMIAPP
jgi:metal-responsive CopG/Arc/MetJ family transcriptional regulator